MLAQRTAAPPKKDGQAKMSCINYSRLFEMANPPLLDWTKVGESAIGKRK
jgi:hypothetical protein